jgi:hypothetical protein
MGEDRLNRLPVAVQHGEDACGQPGLGEQLREDDRCRGILLGGLEDERVAGRQRDREHPQRHHGGKLNGVIPATTLSGSRRE